MEHTLQYSLFLVAIKILAVSSMGTANYDDSKIQNGVPVSIEQWPFVGSYIIVLFKFPIHNCMTSLITPRLAMTAAHCVVRSICVDPMQANNYGDEDNDLVEAYVVMGSETPEYPVGDYQKIRIIRAFMHEYFYPAPTPYVTQYDIAVVKVRHSFSLNRNVALATLYPMPSLDSDAVLRGLINCKVAGWGHTDMNGSFVSAWDLRPGILMGSLREIKVELMSRTECCDKYIVPVRELRITLEDCIRNLTEMGHSCFEQIYPGDSAAKGDSGAAIECGLANQNNNPRVVVGTYVGGIMWPDPLMPYRLVKIPMYRTTIKTMVEFVERMKKGGLPPPPGRTDPPDVTIPTTKFTRYTRPPPTTKFKRFTDELKK